MHRLALLLLVLALAIGGCGGDDDEDGGGGSGDAAADIESCLQDADLDVRDRDVTELDEELVAAGATKQFAAIDVNQQEYSYEVTVFSAPEKASAYAQKQQAEFDEQPQLKFQVKAFGANAVTTTSDAPKREDVSSCADKGQGARAVFEGVKVKTSTYGSFKEAINEAGWLEDEVVAAGHLRQGKAGAQILEQVQLLLPSRSKKLPRHFVLAVTASEVVAFRATEVGQDSNAAIYQKLKIRAGVRFRYPRASVSLTDLPEGEKSSGGTITIDGDSFPVMRPNPYGDPNTNELMAVLGR